MKKQVIDICKAYDISTLNVDYILRVHKETGRSLDDLARECAEIEQQAEMEDCMLDSWE